MKTNKLDEVRWKNPWKIFKQGTLPLGLADAFNNKYGYDGLWACRIYIWLDHLRGFAWRWILLTVAMFVVSICVTADPNGRIRQDAARTVMQSNAMRFSVAVSGTVALWVFMTRKTFWRSRKRMTEFKWKIEEFVSAFRTLLECDPPLVHSKMTQGDLHLEIIRNIGQRHAIPILEAEIIGREAITDRAYLAQKSSAANAFGLGDEWSVYFDYARRHQGDPYELFAWEI